MEVMLWRSSEINKKWRVLKAAGKNGREDIDKDHFSV